MGVWEKIAACFIGLPSGGTAGGLSWMTGKKNTKISPLRASLRSIRDLLINMLSIRGGLFLQSSLSASPKVLFDCFIEQSYSHRTIAEGKAALQDNDSTSGLWNHSSFTIWRTALCYSYLKFKSDSQALHVVLNPVHSCGSWSAGN